LQGTTSRVSIDSDTPPGVIGPITAGLLAAPSGVASVGLLASVSFDNVTLQKRLTNQIPAAITPVGPTTYSAVVNTSVVPAIAVIVRDSNGDPIAGTMVNYTAPATGASLNPATGSVVTDRLGVATFTPLANTIAGTYQVVVTIPGSAVTMSFTLTNLAGPPAQIGTPTGPIPTAQIGMPLSTPVAAIVLDVFGNPVSGATVGFSAPANGPSATLSASSATTNAQGIASVTGVANLIAGNYAIATQVSSLSGSVPALNLLPATISTTRDGQPEQSADIGTEFRCLLLVRAIDDTGAPQPGLAVDFEAPVSGASATLIYGMMQGTSLRVPTDVDGFAWVQARGNGVVGTYPVTALLAFSPTAVARTFVLRNLAVGDAQFSTGFDGLCARGTMP
ncbi:MAG: Ig-like domain-containing protein, partial [Dokdonella sp.]